MEIVNLLNTLKDKHFRTTEAENPELVELIKKLQEMGLVRMMQSAEDGTISVAITTDGFNEIAAYPPQKEQ